MRLYLLIIIGCLLLKLYSSYSFEKAESENAEIEQFITYDYNTKLNDRAISALKNEISNLSGSDKKLTSTTRKLLKDLPNIDYGTPEDFINILNDSELRTILNYPIIDYKGNQPLSQAHYKINLLTDALSKIAVLMDSVVQVNYHPSDNFILTEFQESGDSMQIVIAYGLKGPVENMSIVYNGITHELDSLPINFGPPKGEVKLSLINPITNEKRWYSKEF